MTCVTNGWVHFFHVPNGVSPSNEFLFYSVNNPLFPSGNDGADFHVDNAEVVGTSADGILLLECVDATPATPGN
jgi:hypothetical protein